MEITSRTNGDCLVLDLNGRLFLGRATKLLRNTVHEAVKNKPRKIVLDMSKVTHIDTCGLGEMISCRSHARSLGQNLVLLNPQERTMRQLIYTKLETVFDIFYDEDLAVANAWQQVMPA